MITIQIKKDQISVTGHARAGPPGQDIVCAGVSTLCLTLAKSIKDLTPDHPDIDMGSGNFIMSIKDLSEKSRTLVDSFFIGICGIADAYPEYVRII